MHSCEKIIMKNQLIKKDDVIGIAASGGRDSMCLLHYLNSLTAKMNFKIIAINVDHSLRKASTGDSQFVINYCQKNNIPCKSFKVDIPKIMKEKGLSAEAAAREYRYKIFNALLNEGVVNKIALGHHMQDQAETILLNILRGSGITGASGMEVVRDKVFIRPLITTTRAEITAYNINNDVPFVEDETNSQNDYSRNYIRNMIMPLLRNRWPQADSTICNFGGICKQDDDYIYSKIRSNIIVQENESTVKVPIIYFKHPASVINRILMLAFKRIKVVADVEQKHLKIITGLALEGENGNRISLPNKVSAIKEYDYVTITNKNYEPEELTWNLAKGKIDIPDFGVIEMVQTRKFNIENFNHLIDHNKIPKGAIWRYRKEGDIFQKFGGGTKSLSDYLIDIKIPARLRAITPVLAYKNEVYVIAGIEISNAVKITPETKTAWGINCIRF